MRGNISNLIVSVAIFLVYVHAGCASAPCYGVTNLSICRKARDNLASNYLQKTPSCELAYTYPSVPSVYETTIAAVLRIFIPVEYVRKLPDVVYNDAFKEMYFAKPFRLTTKLFSNNNNSITVHAENTSSFSIEDLIPDSPVQFSRTIYADNQFLKTESPIGMTVYLSPNKFPMHLPNMHLSVGLDFFSGEIINNVCTANSIINFQGSTLQIKWRHPKVITKSTKVIYLHTSYHILSNPATDLADEVVIKYAVYGKRDKQRILVGRGRYSNPIGKGFFVATINVDIFDKGPYVVSAYAVYARQGFEDKERLVKAEIEFVSTDPVLQVIGQYVVDMEEDSKARKRKEMHLRVDMQGCAEENTWISLTMMDANSHRRCGKLKLPIPDHYLCQTTSLQHNFFNVTMELKDNCHSVDSVEFIAELVSRLEGEIDIDPCLCFDSRGGRAVTSSNSGFDIASFDNTKVKRIVSTLELKNRTANVEQKDRSGDYKLELNIIGITPSDFTKCDKYPIQAHRVITLVFNYSIECLVDDCVPLENIKISIRHGDSSPYIPTVNGAVQVAAWSRSFETITYTLEGFETDLLNDEDIKFSAALIMVNGFTNMNTTTLSHVIYPNGAIRLRSIKNCHKHTWVQITHLQPNVLDINDKSVRVYFGYNMASVCAGKKCTLRLELQVTQHSLQIVQLASVKHEVVPLVDSRWVTVPLPKRPLPEGTLRVKVAIDDEDDKVIKFCSATTMIARLREQSAAMYDQEKKNKNIIFVMIDDLGDSTLQPYGDEQSLTPNLAKLAASGTSFMHHYVDFAVCVPSRCSMLSGIRTIGSKQTFSTVTQYWKLPGASTIERMFLQHGYTTYSFGKAWHPVHRANMPGFSRFYDPTNRKYVDEDLDKLYKNSVTSPPVLNFAHEDLSIYGDGRMVDRAISVLEHHKRVGHPFFMAVGFRKPHLPFVAPLYYWNAYEAVPLRDRQEPPPEGYDEIASLHGKGKWGGFPSYAPYSNLPMDSDIYTYKLPHVYKMNRGYKASMTFVDDLLGKLVDAVDDELRPNSVLLVWGDHGYHLGDLGRWSKNTLFEAALRAPLIFVTPEHWSGERKSLEHDAIVESVDIFPTLLDICNISSDGIVLDGLSLVSLFDDVEQQRKQAALSVNIRNGGLGISVRTKQYRYTQWYKAKKIWELPNLNNLAVNTILESGLVEYVPEWDELYDFYSSAYMEKVNIALERNVTYIVNELSRLLKFITMTTPSVLVTSDLNISIVGEK
eukprot:m.10646 g.10646  ORF g.10646 m.10646 type:complete len:1246 (+) comp4301_c0_seq1:364-4101(+)